MQDADDRHRGPSNGGATKVEQERLRKLEAMELKQKELESAKRDEEQILQEIHKRRHSENVVFASRNEPTPPPPLPAVPPPETSPTTNPSTRLDMLVGKKVDTPTKKVSFMGDSDDYNRLDNNANDLQDEKLSRLERVERDPNVSRSFPGSTLARLECIFNQLQVLCSV